MLPIGAPSDGAWTQAFYHLPGPRAYLRPAAARPSVPRRPPRQHGPLSTQPHPVISSLTSLLAPILELADLALTFLPRAAAQLLGTSIPSAPERLLLL